MPPLDQAWPSPWYLANSPPPSSSRCAFLRPVRLGTVIGRARIVHRGEAMVFAEGELRDPDNRLLATATATLRIVTIPNVELDFGQGVAEHKL
jgi:Thioesterase superfamily